LASALGSEAAARDALVRGIGSSAFNMMDNDFTHRHVNPFDPPKGASNLRSPGSIEGFSAGRWERFASRLSVKILLVVQRLLEGLTCFFKQAARAVRQ
jgi:hypothetical protein